jgi:hypothetical protein
MWCKCELYKHALNICSVDNVLVWCPPCKLENYSVLVCHLTWKYIKQVRLNEQQPANAAAIMTGVCA